MRQSGSFFRRRLNRLWSSMLAIICATLLCSTARAQSGPTPGQNINMVSGTTWPDGDPFLQRQNEPSIAVSTRNPQHLLAGANDYRTVDLNFFATGETGDAWLGLFKSFDGGASWQSTLLPGYPLDQSPEGKASKLRHLAFSVNAGSDPVVRAGPSGFFGYSGIAFDRATNNGVVLFSRFVDLNNKENGSAATGAQNSSKDPIRYIDTSVIATGSSSAFLDKPWMAIDVARGNTTCHIQVPLPSPPGGSVPQSLAVGNIYVAFTVFNSAGTSSQILFSRSVDCGATWSKPINLTATDDVFDRDHDSLNQAPTIAIDPETGFVYVAWRRFHSADHSDSIVGTASISGGQWFIPGIPIITLPQFNPANPPTGPNGPFSFFDQNPLTNFPSAAMRTLAFPSLAVEDSGIPFVPGRIFLAWSQRGVGPNGEARIMMVASPDGLSWPTPFPIDNGPLSDLGGEVLGNLGMPLTRGHQFMPQITFTGGKLMVLYYDLRQDHTLGFFTPNSPFAPDPLLRGSFYREDRMPEGELPGNPAAVFTPFLDDARLTARRHTLDVVVAQFDPKSGPLTAANFTTARVSQYRFGFRNDGTDVPGQLQQLQVNPPNFPLFKGGTTPFLGDYVDIAGLAMVPKANGSWGFNTGRSSANTGSPITPVFHATWTDNRDVRPPKDGNWQNYTPVGGGGMSIFTGTPTSTPACLVGNEGMRNQNIYTSRITQGLVVSSPQNSKPLSASLQRAFVVLVQNLTNSDRTFRLTIQNQPPGSPANGFASFTPGTNNPGPVPPAGPPTPPSPVVTTLDVKAPAHSGVAASVFAVSSSPTATITVNVDEITAPMGSFVPGGLSSFVVLNPDATTPPLINPDGGTDIASQEVYTPNFSNPNYSNPNYSNPNFSNPNFSNPNYSNPNFSNPNFSNPDIATSTVSNPNYSNGDVSNPNFSNPNYSNPNFSNTNLTDSAVSDASYTLTNNGNTSAGYDVNLVLDGTLPGNAQFQLLINKTYLTPIAQNCALTQEQTTTVASVVTNPNFSNPNFSNPNFSNPNFSNSSLSLAPGESATITLRGFNVTCLNTAQRCKGPITGVANIEDVATQVTPVVTTQAANTNDPTNSHQTVIPVFITTAALPDAVNGRNYSGDGFRLQAIGGKPPYIWGFSGEGSSLPSGLGLSSAGVISGAPDTEAGTFTFTVQVTDSTTPVPQTATRQLSIRVANPLAVATASPLPTAIQGVTPPALNFAETGGIGPYSWTPVAVDGMTLSSGGVFSGTPASTGSFNFTAQVTDSASTAQTASKLMTLNVVVPVGFLNFSTQPTSTVGGIPIRVAVVALDGAESVAPGVNITLALGNNPSGATLSAVGNTSLTVATDATGTATFLVTIDRGASAGACPGGAFTLMATATGGPSTISNCFGISGFAPTGSMADGVGRISPTATLLNNGMVLVTGGSLGGPIGDATTLATAELYNPTTKTFASTGSMNAPRSGHTATLLNDGTVLIVGGAVDATNAMTAEIYNPTTGIFTYTTGSTAVAHTFHTATLLGDGTVLVAGGGSGGTTAEIYNPMTGTFSTTTGNMTILREFHTATLLTTGPLAGQVLLIGGQGAVPNSLLQPLASGELYDPATQMFTATTSNLATARFLHTATILPNGNVYVIGGTQDGLNGLASAEVFTASTPFSLTSLFDNFNTAPVTQQIGGPPTPTTFTLSDYAFINQLETYHFNDGGGTADVGTISLQDQFGNTLGPFEANGFTSASTPGPPNVAWIASVSLNLAPGTYTVMDSDPSSWSFNSTSNNSGFVRVSGTFVPEFRQLSPTLSVARAYHTATLLPNGSVLVAGGQGGAATPNLSSAEIFNVGGDTPARFSVTGSLITARRSHAAVLLPDGTALIVAGNGNSGPLASAEIYYPGTEGVAITNVALNSTTLSIGGASVGYTATLSNGTGSTVSNVLVQAFINQGNVSRAAGGSLVTCGQTLGDLAPGSCNFNAAVSASNSTAGTGTLVPGPATARFELRGPNTLFSAFTVTVTLQ